METAAMLDEALDKMLASDHAFLSASEAAALAGTLERVGRKLDALKVAVVDVVDRNGLFAEDGHRSAKTWLAFTCRVSTGEAHRRVSFAKMFRTLNETGCRYRTGEIGTDQVGELARAFRNPRCGHLLGESEALLLDHERELTAKQFEIAVKHWLSVADAEGIKQRHDSLHKHRDLRITPQFDGGFKIDGTFGPEQGAAIKEVHDRYTETERLVDWAAAKAEHGDVVTPADMARTEAQRRADAFYAIFVNASSTPAGAQKPEPLVTIIMSEDAYQAGLADIAGEEVVFDPKRYRRWQCETLGGTTLTPGAALAAAMAGHIRRVVIGASEASISQKTRVFTGPLRRLIQTRDTTCVWAGCDIPSDRCQADHITPWRATQDTSAGNGAPLCGRHNRYKEHGYHTSRDANGNWHIQRPNGTTITPTA
jgi:Domain of unknown function (DUF222)